MEYLFLASIGPVQSFIASARRSRDLWFGSWLLSELSKAAAYEIVNNRPGNSLIFPAPPVQQLHELLKEGSNFNVANKIVALIDQSPQQLGDAVYKTMKARLNAIKDQALPKNVAFDQTTADKQIDDLIEYFWVALPFENTDYAAARRNLEAVLAARKNTRDFKPVSWGNNIPKSSLDGQLESVIPEPKYPDRNDSDEDKAKKIKYLYENYGAGPAERLSGVDLLKRRSIIVLDEQGESASNFPSTSHMAAIPFLQRLGHLNNKKEAKQLWEAYVAQINAIPGLHVEHVSPRYRSVADSIIGACDGSMLFEERLIDMIDMGQNKKEAAEKLKSVKEKLQAFFNEVNKQIDRAYPNPYYAILLADGDRMGKVIDNEAKQGEKRHQALSKALNIFASSVRRIVEEKHQGALVYAGGDDALALMPLHTVLQCAKELADNFRKELTEFKDDNGNPPTLSAGIVIVHHLYSLQDALRLARDAEERAKKVYGKDALAVIISKRSGDDYMIADKWDNMYSHLEHLIDYYYSGAIPEGTAYELRDLALRLAVPNVHPNYGIIQEVILADAKRILERKMRFAERNQKKDSEQTKQILALLQDRLGIAQEHDEDESAETITVDVAIDQFINELIIAQTLADVKTMIEPKKEQRNGNLAH